MLAIRQRKEAAAAPIYTTQNLRRLLQRLSVHPRPRLLDVGHLCGPNIEWLIQKGCKVCADDCFRVLKALPPPPGKTEKRPDPPFLKEVAQKYPAYFDAVLCWDLLDYLTVDQASELVRLIGSLLKPRGLIFACFNFNRASPPPPTRYRILSETRLEYQTIPENLPLRQTHENRDIQEIFDRYEVINSCLLKHQMREILIEKTT